MKKITVTFAFFFVFIVKSIGQVNPIENLVWEQHYFFGHYDYGLIWDAPATPHDELIGYNIYRDNELFRFQTESYLTNMGINPNCDQGFMNFPSDGDGFDIYVEAVYNPGGIASGYVETVHADNNLLPIASFEKSKVLVYPNPTTGILNIGNENLTTIVIYDSSGKKVKEFEASNQIDLVDFSKGIYVIQLISEEGIMTEKIVIE